MPLVLWIAAWRKKFILMWASECLPEAPILFLTQQDRRGVIICFIPRILVGVVPFYVYHWMRKIQKKNDVSTVGLILAGISGALVNTLLVMNLIFVFFRDAYAAANGVAANAVYGFILSVIGINGVPEAIVAGILTVLIGRVLLNKNVRAKLGV